MSRKHIVAYSADEIDVLLASGASRSDFARAGAMTEAEVEASIAADPDEAGLVVDWSRASVEAPKPKAVLD